MANETLVLKEVGTFEIKDADKGEIEAVIATLGVIDRDGDIIKEGAIKSGSKVKMSGWGHDAVFGETPVGKGAITIDGERAVFKGRIFLNTTRGREVFEVLKEMGKEQEWSFGFQVKGSEVPDDDQRKAGAWRILTKIDAFEVSPVLLGAGIGTHTVAVKEADAAAEAARIAEEARVAAETKAAEDVAREAETKAAAIMAANDAALEEFDRFQRTRRRLG